MKAAQLYKKFESTVNKYEKELAKYSPNDIARKPSPYVWSIGQVYEHIISNTLSFHVPQIELCLLNNEHRYKSKNFVGLYALLIKRIPHININIPPEESVEPSQPSDISAIYNRLNGLKDTFYHLALKIDSSKINGKRHHTGFGYLHAKEWYALIEMHLRYHWKDKEIIDKYLFS